MPQLRMNISTEFKGAIFKASDVKAASARMVKGLNDTLAQEAVRRVKSHLRQVLKHPSGHYESNITVQRRSTYRGVWDSDVPYGGWLEGVDPRNRTTKFRGYNTFTIIDATMRQDKDDLVRPFVASFIKAMNG